MEYDQYADIENFFILKFSSNKFIDKMTLSIKNGFSVLIEDVDETLDPSLDAVLGKAVAES